ncbi:MAG: helix-turn-helix domain-containing protein [Clostridia bacterium]|nr:helix-turn-helix domain-containing protein [Clostridia bacterium]
MFYEKELAFFRGYLKNLGLNSYIVPSDESYDEVDFQLRKFLTSGKDYNVILEEVFKNTKDNTIYKITDSFLCCYIFLRLPDTDEPCGIIIGPYLDCEISKETKLNLAEKFNISSQTFKEFEKYYTQVPLIANESNLFILFNTLGETIWGGLENFTIERIEEATSYNFGEATKYIQGNTDKPQLSVHLIESTYEKENRLMDIVSQGLINNAEMIISKMTNAGVEQRSSDPVRNIKNYSVILNTLLRKAAEHGSVHPYYIDKISSDFAVKIEMANSLKEIEQLQKEMIRSYCQLVKKHSMKNYSHLIQKVLTTIDSEITGDLSLNAQAKALNVNPSYLSSLFKKETGMTLTDYVNKKRAEHAARLLKTTNMQIQTISQYCGIYDVNYFTKIFKKYFGKTPKEYRES